MFSRQLIPHSKLISNHVDFPSIVCNQVLDDAIAYALFATFNRMVSEDAVDQVYAATTIITYFIATLVGSMILGYLMGVGFARFVQVSE